jgi:hypothetical protein
MNFPSESVGGYLRRGPNLHTMDGGGDQRVDLTASVDLTVFERCDRRHRSAVRQRFIFWTTHWERGRKAEKGRELSGENYRPRDRDPGAALDAAVAAFMGAIEDQG